ncbi:MAG: xanthine dehydrogenase family protein molybdopterin-binding subunit [Xanthobacteraceae bacterium]
MSGTSGSEFRQIGRPLLRKEDYRLLTGQARYVDDIAVPGALHAHFVRSPHAHARIRAIAADRASAMLGVVAVVAGRDVLQWTTTMRMAPPIAGLQPTEITTLPVDKVRFQGDPVVAIVAVDRYLAEDAAEAIEIDYDVLPHVLNFADAVRETAPLVDESLSSNLISHQSFQKGEVRARMQAAHAVVEAAFSQHRQTHLPIETRGCLAIWDRGREHLTFHVGTQVPHPLRTQLAARLRLSESQITVISADAGGAFGQKIALYREELTVAALARQLGQPVRWREDRLENLQAASHAREQTCRVRAGVDHGGHILALDLAIEEDFGAYCFYPANYLARVVAMILTGPYRVENYSFDVKVALTNKCGAGPMRAPMSITSWVMEGTIDAIARKLGLDPLDVRRANALRHQDLPYTMATGEVLEDITPAETLEAAVAAADYRVFRKRQADERTKQKYLGLGICTVVESTTYGSRFYKSAGIPGSGHEAAWVRIEPSGAVNASVGLMASGQGYETALAQAVADGLGVDAGAVRIQLGNTDVAPYGMGSRGARGATAGGGALYLCADKARERVLTIATAMLQLNSPAELRMVDGVIERRIEGKWTDTGVTLGSVARTAYLDPGTLPEGVPPGLDFSLSYDPPPMTYSNSTHVCIVEVHVDTGRIGIERYLVAEDCGTALNPILMRGQQQGAIAMGLSGAMFEQVQYHPETGQNLTSTLADYLVATACELPDFEIIPMHTPNRRTPAGIKGMAEGGVMGAIGAITNAVNDALAPFNVTVERQPLSPQAIRELLRGASPPASSLPRKE